MNRARPRRLGLGLCVARRAAARLVAAGLSAAGLLAAVSLGACSDAPTTPRGDTAAVATTALSAGAARCVALGAADSNDSAGLARACLFDDDAAPSSFTVRVAAADLAWLDAHAIAEQYVPATLVYGGTEVAAEVRYKGSTSSLAGCFDAAGVQTCPRLSVKVRIAGGKRFMGLRRFVFNANAHDDTYLRERLAYRLFREGGVVAPRAVHGWLTLGDHPPGLFLLVEGVDGPFLNANFTQAAGLLAKEAWYASDSVEDWQNQLKTSKGGDVARFVAFATALQALSQTSDAAFAATYVQVVSPWLDLDALARWLAVDMFIDNWDGPRGSYCDADAANTQDCSPHNFYIYDDPSSGKLQLIPWDLDLTFRRPDTDMGRSWWLDGPGICDIPVAVGHSFMKRMQCDPLMRGLIRVRWAAYTDALAKMSAPQAPLSTARVHSHLDRYRAMIGPLMVHDTLAPTMERWEAETAELRAMIEGQSAQVMALLAWPLPATATHWMPK